MPNSLKSLLVSLTLTVVVAVVAYIVALALSLSGGSSDGIGAYAGGVSRRYISGLLLALPVVFIALFFLSRRVFR
jgi:hypothetical protein